MSLDYTFMYDYAILMVRMLSTKSNSDTNDNADTCSECVFK